LQFETGLFRSTWLTLRTHTGEGNCGKICELVSPKCYAVWQDGAWEDEADLSPLPQSGGLVRGVRRGDWRLVFRHRVWEGVGILARTLVVNIKTLFLFGKAPDAFFSFFFAVRPDNAHLPLTGV
jgi:hypothetical protein